MLHCSKKNKKQKKDKVLEVLENNCSETNCRGVTMSCITKSNRNKTTTTFTFSKVQKD